MEYPCGLHSFEMVIAGNEAKATTAVMRKLICIVTRKKEEYERTQGKTPNAQRWMKRKDWKTRLVGKIPKRAECRNNIVTKGNDSTQRDVFDGTQAFIHMFFCHRAESHEPPRAYGMPGGNSPGIRSLRPAIRSQHHLLYSFIRFIAIIAYIGHTAHGPRRGPSLGQYVINWNRPA